MKRCPDCGFRANDNTCPLCGVRMRNLPGEMVEQKTHVHRQQGEQCVLPNQKSEKRVVSEPRPKRDPSEAHVNRRRSAKSSVPVSSKVWQTILVVAIVILFRACAA